MNRQPQRNGRYVGDAHQRRQHRKEKRQQWFGDTGDRRLSNTATNEQTRSHRRRTQTNAQIRDQHDAEVNWVHSQRHHDRQKNRCENQNGRRHVHKRTHHDQQQVDDDQNHDWIFGQTQQSGTDRLRNVGHRHDPAHPGAGSDQQHHHCRRDPGLQQDLRQLGPFDFAIKNHRQHKRVDHGNRRRLGRREGSNQNASDHNHDQQQSQNGT